MLDDLVARPDQITDGYVSAIALRVGDTLPSHKRQDLYDLAKGLENVERAMIAQAPQVMRDVLIHNRKTSPEDPILKAYRLGQLDMAQQILSQEAGRRADDDTVTIGRQNSALLRPLIQGGRPIAAVAAELGLTIAEVRADYMILYRKGIVLLDNHNGASTFASLTPTIGRLLVRDLELETEHG